MSRTFGRRENLGSVSLRACPPPGGKGVVPVATISPALGSRWAVDLRGQAIMTERRDHGRQGRQEGQGQEQQAEAVEETGAAEETYRPTATGQPQVTNRATQQADLIRREVSTPKLVGINPIPRSAVADARDEDVPTRDREREIDSISLGAFRLLEQPVAFDSGGCFCVGSSVWPEHLGRQKMRGLFLEPPLPLGALVHESELARKDPTPQTFHLPVAYDAGLPSPVIRLRMLHAITASVTRPPRE